MLQSAVVDEYDSHAHLEERTTLRKNEISKAVYIGSSIPNKNVGFV